MARNTILADLPPGPIFAVSGHRNVLSDNIIGVYNGVGLIFAVGGTGNTLDGNIAAGVEGTTWTGTGIAFSADGNFYGGNRMAATVPFALGGTVQIDWGGNVGY